MPQPGNTVLRSFLSGLGLGQTLVMVVALLAILVGSVSVTALIEHRFRETIANALETLLEGTDQAIRIWARDHRRTALGFAQSDGVMTAVESLLETPRDQASLLASDGQRRLRNQFRLHLQTGQYRGFFIIGPDNLSLASSRDVNVGVPNLLVEQPDVLDELWAGEAVLSRLQPTDVPLGGSDLPYPEETMFIGAPVRNALGDIVALLTLRIDPHKTLFPLLNQGHLGETGATYSFDRDGYLLFQSRLEPQLRALGLRGPLDGDHSGESAQEHARHVRLRIADPGVDLRTDREAATRTEDRPLTRMAASAIRGRRGVDMDGYRDYRGVPVVGVWLWDETLNLGLATEQDVADAYDLFHFVRALIYFGASITTLIVLTLAAVFARGRLQVQETRNRLKAVFDTAADGIVIIDRNGCIEDVNPAMEEMFGYPAATLLSSNVSILIPAPDARRHDGYLRRYQETGEAHIIGSSRETEAKRADGSLFSIELSVSRLELESGLRFAGVIRDISERQQAERLLGEAEERRRLILESAGEGIYGLDDQGITTFINPAAARMLGYASDELIGKPMHATVHYARADGSPYPQEECPMYAAFIHGDIQQSSNEVLWRKDGRCFPVEYTTTPIRKDGQLAGAVITFRDITERRQLESRLEQALETAERERDAATEANRIMALTRAALDRTGIAELWISASEGKVAWVSDRACEYLGYSRAELLGMRLPDFDLAFPLDRLGQPQLPIEEHDWDRCETVHQTRDGHRLPVEITAMFKPAGGDGDDILIAFVTDITQRKEVEAQLIQAREEAEEANRAKSTFLATMSHEIRTPLNGVVGTIDMLERTSLLPYQQDLVRTAKESARMLQGVIDDVLDFSKIEAGRLELESIPLSLEVLLETLGKNLNHLAAKQGVELLIYCDPWLPPVKGDPVRLNQILFNLAGNAIKFSKNLPNRSGQVLISVAMREQMADQVEVVLRVEDNGIGMSAEVRERLFQPFVQGEGVTTRRFGGTGLGLVITQRLVELMGGRIEVQSESDRGSTFSVFLTLESVQETSNDAMRKSLEGLLVLLIKDDDEPARILESYLRHAGARVAPVPPSQALAACQELCDGTAKAVVVIDNHGDKRISSPVLEVLRREARASDPHFILVERGRRRYPRIDQEDSIALDLNAMRRGTLINTVAVAAGWESPEDTAEPDITLSTSVSVSVDEARAAGRLILLADDNETNRKVIGQQLNMLGYGVGLAEDGKQALAKWQADDFDLVLTDCHMPVMDGYQLSRRIRELERGARRSPIVAISADAMKGTAEKCLDAGMDDYVTKPIQLHELRAVLDKWLGSGAQTGDEQDPVQPDLARAEAVDPRALGELLGTQDPLMLADFYDDFVQTGSETADSIQGAYAASDIAELGRLAHKLKSSARTVGANALADSCLVLEEAAKASHFEVVAQEIGRFSVLFEQVREWIEHNRKMKG